MGKDNIKNEKSNSEKNEEMKCATINSGSDVVSMYIVPVRVKKRNPSMKFKICTSGQLQPRDIYTR